MNGDEAILAIHTNIESLRKDVTSVMVNGCAKREGDVKELKTVKDDMRDMKNDIKNIYRTSLVTAGGIILFLLKAFLPYLIK